MKNTFAVYSKKPIITPRKLVEAARKIGLELRFMGVGGFSFRTEKSDKEYFDSPLQDGILLIGAFDSDKECLEQFDAAVKKNDSEFVRVMLHTDRLPWCEVHSKGFHYAGRREPYKKIIDSWTPVEDQSTVQSAKTRYLIDNVSRRKSGQRLAEQTALILRELGKGIVTEFGARPSKTPAKRPLIKPLATQPPEPKPTATKKPKDTPAKTKPVKKLSQAESKKIAKALRIYATDQSWDHIENELNSGRPLPIEESDMLDAFGRCILANQTKLVEKFIELGMDIDNKEGRFPHLARAAGTLKIEATALLLAKGADPNLQERVYGRTPLRMAVQRGAALVRYYTTKRIEMFVPFDGDSQSTYLSCHEFTVDPRDLPEFVEIATLLLKAGADPNIADHYGFTALDVLASAHYPKMVELLFRYDARLDAGFESGRYALEQCIRFGDAKTFRLFLDHGVDLTLPLSNGENAKEMIDSLKRKELAALLSKAKPPKKKWNIKPTTPATPKEWQGCYRPDFEATISHKKQLDPRGQVKKADFVKHYQSCWPEYECRELEISDHRFIVRTPDETRDFPIFPDQHGINIVCDEGVCGIFVKKPGPGLLFLDVCKPDSDGDGAFVPDKAYQVIWKRKV